MSPDLPNQPAVILVQDDAALPYAIPWSNDVVLPGWKQVAPGARATLEADLIHAGWSFFFMAGEIKTTGFGSDPEKRQRAAIDRAVREVQSQNCNSVEISSTVAKSFCGIPFVSVTAHARHIQKGTGFRGILGE